MKKLTFFLTAILALAPVLDACGDSVAPVDTSPSGSEGTSDTTAAPMDRYDYPDVDYKGETFTILSPTNTWGIIDMVDTDEQNGEMLNDAIYDRNRGLEERFNFKMEVASDNIQKITDLVRTTLTAGDDVWDVIFNAATYNGTLVLEGFYYDLNDIPQLQLDKEYWDQSCITESTFNGSIFSAMTDFNLYGIEGTWCTFFNENMLEDLNLDTPYELVRQGKWTLDELGKYAKAGYNLNGDSTFDWNPDGNAIYGLTSSYAFSHTLIIASDIRYISRDKDGYPVFTLESDRFYDLVDKWTTISGAKELFVSQNHSGTANHYELIFKARRALFLGAELKAAQLYRDFDDSYGIAPAPKFDEAQEDYVSVVSKASPVMCIPLTNKDTERTGVIMDALAFESFYDVLPVYSDVVLSQKGLRNEESIEMLEIIRDTRFFDVGDAYGWTTKVQDLVRKALDVGDDAVASLIASQIPTIEANIKTTMDMMK